MLSTPDKIATDVLEILRSAKEGMVRRLGIGTDIRLSLFSYRGDDIVSYCQMLDTTVREEQTLRIAQAITLLRFYYGIDTVVIGVEGFVAISEDEGDGGDLPQRFGLGDAAVQECLTVIYADDKRNHRVMTQSYRYLVPGRRIAWDKPEMHSDPGSVRGALPRLMGNVFLTQPLEVPEPWNEEVQALNRGTIERTIESLGFIVVGPEG